MNMMFTYHVILKKHFWDKLCDRFSLNREFIISEFFAEALIPNTWCGAWSQNFHLLWQLWTILPQELNMMRAQPWMLTTWWSGDSSKTCICLIDRWQVRGCLLGLAPNHQLCSDRVCQQRCPCPSFPWGWLIWHWAWDHCYREVAWEASFH